MDSSPTPTSFPMTKEAQNRDGTSHEARFAAEALARGYDVLNPVGDYLPYDLVTVSRPGVRKNIQVKGSATKIARSYYYRVTAATGNASKVPLDPELVDVLAAYVVPHEAWYLVPVSRLPGVTAHFSPQVARSRGKYEIWRDAWNVLE